MSTSTTAVTNDMEDLATSFANLRQTARSNDDVAGWFAQHPACIPNLPEHLRPYVKLMLVTERCGLRYKKDEAGLLQHVYMRFSAVQPDEEKAVSPVEALSTLLGQKIEMPDEKNETTVLSGEFYLPLEPTEWPYVISSIAMGALGNSTELFKELSEVEWNRCNLGMDWERLKALHDADLLPDSLTEFCDWLKTTSSTPLTSCTPPSEMTL